MEHNFNLKNLNWKSLILAITTLILGLLTGSGIALTATPDGNITVASTYRIELADEQVPTLIENANGEIEELSAPTVEMIDSKQAFAEGELDFGQGSVSTRDLSSPDTYKNQVIGYCIDIDGKWGSQCVDLFAEFHYNYTGRWLSNNGTGAAYGLWDARDYNAGDDYELIANPHDLQPGDWVIFSGGEYGHVGMAVGYYNNGYIALLGENQGGSPCAGGGSSANIINMSLANFRGAFRPKIYVKPAPAPEPEPEPALPEVDYNTYSVKAGDTLSDIMSKLEGYVEYGESMNDYAKSWRSTLIVPGQTVYDGWTSGTGYGLFAGDIIQRR